MEKQPIRVFEGNAKPHERFWQIRNEEGAEPQIDFYGVISEYSWFGDEITPQMFKSDLYAAGKNGPVTVHIDSPGGTVDAASTIRAIMMDYPGSITVKIDGLCASAAVLVAMAGDKVLMQESGYMMIHDPWSVAVGGASDFKAAAKMLDEVKAGIVDCYETRTQLERSKLEKMMSDETWMNARTAKEYGFIDEIMTGSVYAANLSKAAVVNCLKNYLHVPVELMPMPGAPAEPVKQEVPLAPEPQPTPVDGNKAREMQNLRDYLDVYGKGAKK